MEFNNNSNLTSSLMFGLQWDLVCKFLEEKSDLSQDNINKDSSNWGNYPNISLNIDNGKLSKIKKYENNKWLKADSTTKSEKCLLSVGASEQTKKLNIYDFGGNVWEMTLETNSTVDVPGFVLRGGAFDSKDSEIFASSRATFQAWSDSWGFRIALWLQ